MVAPRGDAGEKEKYVFLPGIDIFANRCENLHDGRALSHTWVSSLLMATSLGVSKCFWTICLRRSFGDLRHIQLSTHVADVQFMSGHRLLPTCRRRFTCNKLCRFRCVIRREHSSVIDHIFIENREFCVHTCIRRRR